ncbi:hypothetical protein [uncultured Methylobacterium sp.]
MTAHRGKVKQIAILAVTAAIAFQAAGCLGKGKAPPPIDAPIIRKG